MTPFSFQPHWSFTEGDREGSGAEGEGEGISKHGAKASQGLLNREPGAGGAPAACGVPRASATGSSSGCAPCQLFPNRLSWRKRAEPVPRGQFGECEGLP